MAITGRLRQWPKPVSDKALVLQFLTEAWIWKGAISSTETIIMGSLEVSKPQYMLRSMCRCVALDGRILTRLADAAGTGALEFSVCQLARAA